MTSGPDRFRVVLEGKRLLDRYHVAEKLAEGGMGAVYLARDEGLDGIPVVVKVPHARFLAEDGFRERFAREIRELVHLRHPHVVQILARGEDDDVPFFVLQYLAGGSLRERIRRAGGRLAPMDVAAWLPDAAKTLDFIHARGVIHRDVKPANILFDAHGNVFLSDFGIAKALGAHGTGLTQTGGTPGSPDYMAPEVMTDRELSPAYDQYGLAVVVYEALAGVLPHGPGGDTPLRVAYRKAVKAPRPLRRVAEHCSSGLSAVVMRALSRDPRDRFASCSDFAAAFAAALPRAAPTDAEQPTAPGGTEASPASPGRRSAEAGATPTAAPAPVPIEARSVAEARPRRRFAVVGGAATLVGLAAVAWATGLLAGRRGPSDATDVAERTASTPGRAPSPPPPDASSGAAAPSDRGGHEGVAPSAPSKPEPPASQRPPAWATPLREAEAAARDGAWDRARALVAAAKGEGLIEVPAALAAGIAAYEAAPTITIDQPLDGSVVDGETVEFTGTLSSGRSSDRLTLDGRDVPVSGGRWRTTMSIAAGAALDVEFLVLDGHLRRGAARVRVSRKGPRPPPPLAARDFVPAADDGSPGFASTAMDGALRAATLGEFAAALEILAALEALPAEHPAVVDALRGTAAVRSLQEIAALGAGSERAERLRQDSYRVFRGSRWAVLFRSGGTPSPEPAPVAVPSWATVAPEQLAAAKRLGVPAALETRIGLRFVLIPAGRFRMGSPPTEGGRASDETPHDVELTRAFYLSTTEVTNDQFRRFRAQHTSGRFGQESLDDDRQPVVRIRHADATAFAAWMTLQEPGATYRLPTEAEWEFACRAGTATARWWGDDLESARGRASVFDGGGEATAASPNPPFGFRDGYVAAAPVGTFAPNPWGLYDMLGNAQEWCAGWYDAYPTARVVDPQGPASGTRRVARGGSWLMSPGGVRSASRTTWHDDSVFDELGFRVARTL